MNKDPDQQQKRNYIEHQLEGPAVVAERLSLISCVLGTWPGPTND